MQVDQFESVFRAADKVRYRYQRIEFRRILAVTDLPSEQAPEFEAGLRRFLAVLGDEPEWLSLSGSDLTGIQSLLARIQEFEPDLLCTYRCLTSDGYQWPYSLGEYLDVMTQIVSCPVLVIPHPDAGRAFPHALENTDRVLAMTDHLVADSQLVDAAVRFTEPGGVLTLAHLEDEATFERYMDAISKIPAIDTETAREEIRNRLLHDAEDYAHSCQDALKDAGLPIQVDTTVTVASRLEHFRQLIRSQEKDLLVMHTKDEDQLAMHGLSYPLAVEIREIPLLLL